MPEGDTVWRAARRLHESLAGQVLRRSDLRVPALATTDLSGRTVLEVRPRGKHLLTRLTGGLTLHSHLGMAGSWVVVPAGEPRRGGPTHEVRAVLATDRGTAYGYRLRVLELLRTTAEDTAVGHLGPDLLGPDWDARQALRRLLARPDRPLVEALLDQRNLAGVGNVYASELCFLLRLWPWTPMGRVPRAERLPALAKRLLEANKDRATRNTTGDHRHGQALAVYGRSRRPCPRCGTLVRAGHHGPAERARVVYYCPRCQPAPADR